MLSVSLIHDIISVRFAWVGTGYRRSQARVGHYFKWVGHSPEWVGHGLPGLGLEPPLVVIHMGRELVLESPSTEVAQPSAAQFWGSADTF